jgi:hypothetical protein
VNQLATQVKAEMTVVENYVTAKDALVKGQDTGNPPHLDLFQEAGGFTVGGSFAQPFITEAEKKYRANRADWITQIVWRATSIHAELWKSEGPPPSLEVAALDEILDRRLRAVEQMTCNVNALGMKVHPPQRTWSVAGPDGPWKDGFTARNFEYPTLPKAPFAPHLSKMQDWQDAGGSIVFKPRAGAPVLIPKHIRAAWKAIKTGGTVTLQYQPNASRKPSDIIRKMFEPPRSDFLDRSWIFCDMVGCAIGLEALCHANRRRFGNDTAVDAAGNRPGYMMLGPLVVFDRTHDIDVLMRDDADPFFENTEIDLDDLQVGDFVCFWNSRIYDLIAEGAWHNEFSYIMGVDVDGTTGRVAIQANGPRVWVAGHGVSTVIYADMAANVVGWIASALFPLNAQVYGAVQTTPNVTELTSPLGHKLVRWSPYEAFDPPGAWWIRVPKDIWHKSWHYPDVQAVLKAVPRMIAKEAGGQGYNPPDDDTVYFPLFEPIIAQKDTDGDSWRAYLRQRKADPNFRPVRALLPLVADGRLALGLFYRGANTRIPVVRPRVRK